MFKSTPVFAVALALAAFSFSSAQAEEAGAPSYAAKKQGRVPFASASETPAASIETPATEQSVTEIEPAAGAEDTIQTPDEKSSLQDTLRLPRKN